MFKFRQSSIIIYYMYDTPIPRNKAICLKNLSFEKNFELQLP